MRSWRQIFIAIGTLMIVGHTDAVAQRQAEMPLSPAIPAGQPVTPIFEGWYQNPDGSYTLSFGYFNHNLDEVVHIPVGENNIIQPEILNGLQPTYFLAGDARRERGTFTITVPSTFSLEDRVIWTLRTPTPTGVVEHSVPGKVDSPAYNFDYMPMAAGSLPPILRFQPSAPELVGPMSNGGYVSHTNAFGTLERPLELSTSVEKPLELTVWTEDNKKGNSRDVTAVHVAWFTHQGPAQVAFGEPQYSEGGASTTANFEQPGEYLLRVRADNWGVIDSSSADQCCWTNAFVRVLVGE